jgi:hypothetical protein
MRKTFDSVNHLNLKYLKEEGKFFLPMNNKLIAYSYPKLEKISEIVYSDEILDFHILPGEEKHILLIAKNNKTITTLDKNGNILDELYLLN